MIEAFDCFHTQAYIAGQWVDALDGSTFEVLNPVDDSVIAEVANCGSRETEQAITAAHNSLIPCLLYTSPSPRDRTRSRMPSSA